MITDLISFLRFNSLKVDLRCGRASLRSHFILIALVRFLESCRALNLTTIHTIAASDASNISETTLNFLGRKILVQNLQLALALGSIISNGHFGALLARWTYSETLKLVIDFFNASFVFCALVDLSARRLLEFVQI